MPLRDLILAILLGLLLGFLLFGGLLVEAEGPCLDRSCLEHDHGR